MTSLRSRQTRLRFETDDCVRERGRLREVVIEATPYMAYVRLKGCREAIPISWSGVYNLAVKIKVEQARREKAAKKAGK